MDIASCADDIMWYVCYESIDLISGKREIKENETL